MDSLLTREMQIKITKYHFTHISMATIKEKNKIISVRKVAGKSGIFVLWWWECKMVQLLRKTVWQLLKKPIIELPCNSVSGLFPKEVKVRTWTDVCKPMFIDTLLTVVKKQKQPKFSTDEQINKIRNIHMMEYYSVITRKEILTHVTIWMKSEDTMLSEVSQLQESKQAPRGISLEQANS